MGAIFPVTVPIRIKLFPTSRTGIFIHGFAFDLRKMAVPPFDSTGVTTEELLSVARVTAEETVGELVAAGNLFINPAPKFSEIITGEVSLGSEIRLPIIFDESITGNLILGSDIGISIHSAETIEAETVLGADISAKAECFELVSSYTAAEAIETKNCVLTVSLKPGQRLIIDANNYNILLDGENAIHVQSGDWIDELVRNTSVIDITAASGGENIQASILYTERFL